MRKNKRTAIGNKFVWLSVAIAIGIAAHVVACGSSLADAPTKALEGTSAPTSPPTPTELKLIDDSINLSVEPDRSFSLKAAFDVAARSNQELIANKCNLSIAKAAIRIASAIPNPRFSVLYGFGPSYSIIIAGNPQQFGMQQDIQTAGKRTKQINLAKANYGVAELNVAAMLFSVHNRVRRAYAEQAAAEAYEELIESERKVALTLVEAASKRFDSGKAPQSEVLQSQLGVMQFDTQRNQAQARLQQATAALAQLVGETPQRIEVIDVDDNGIFKLSAAKSDLVPPPDHALPQLESLLPVAYSERPDFKLAIQQAYSDRRALTLARAQRIPDLFVDAGYQFTTFRRHQPYGLTTAEVHNQPGAYLNISSEFPIFYHHQGETSQTKGAWKQDFQQIEQLQSQIATDIVTSYESVTVARANIAKFQRQLIPAANTVARQALRRYQLGKSDLASAILAKQQYQQTLSAYFDAVVAYQTAWADLEKAMGAPLKL